MSKKRISRSTMDTCFKILQLKFDQKLANRCIGLAKHQWGLISILRHRRIINTSMVRSNTSVVSPWIKSSNCSQIKTRREFWANASSNPYSPWVKSTGCWWASTRRNGPGSSVQPLKNHSTTLLDLSLGVQPPERVWQGWKETASPQYRPDDRMMLEQKAFAPPLELDSAYRIRKTGWRGGDKLYLQSWKFSDDEKLFNKVIWGVKITSSIND